MATPEKTVEPLARQVTAVIDPIIRPFRADGVVIALQIVEGALPAVKTAPLDPVSFPVFAEPVFQFAMPFQGGHRRMLGNKNILD